MGAPQGAFAPTCRPLGRTRRRVALLHPHACNAKSGNGLHVAELLYYIRGASMTVLETVVSLGRFATVAQVRAAGHSDADILAADERREVCLKVGNDPRLLEVADCIVLSGTNYQFLVV